jgi:S1-C subfamily serine protease
VAVLAVEPGSAAEEAGLQGSQFSIQVNGQGIPAPGDVIVGVNGEPITNLAQLQSLVFARDAGDVIELRIVRDGREMTVPVELRVVPSQQQQE